MGTFEAILAAHRELYDSDCGTYFGCSCGWDNDDIGSNEGYVEHVAGLLATAHAETTTATTEVALDSLPYFTFEDDDVAPDEEFVRKADVARLLATARTRPTHHDHHEDDDR